MCGVYRHKQTVFSFLTRIVAVAADYLPIVGDVGR
jgi:hypothetical protein